MVWKAEYFVFFSFLKYMYCQLIEFTDLLGGLLSGKNFSSVHLCLLTRSGTHDQSTSNTFCVQCSSMYLIYNYVYLCSLLPTVLCFSMTNIDTQSPASEGLDLYKCRKQETCTYIFYFHCKCDCGWLASKRLKTFRLLWILYRYTNGRVV